MTDVTDNWIGSGTPDEIRRMLMIIGIIILALVCAFLIGKWSISMWAWKSEGYVTKKKIKHYKNNRWQHKLYRRIKKKKKKSSKKRR